MKEKPILFNGEMVRAILDGRKTQTRRVVKTQPVDQYGTYYFRHRGWEYKTGYTDEQQDGSTMHPLDMSHFVRNCCPYGQPGDRLWVREAWAAPHKFDGEPPRAIPASANFHYAATEERGGLLWRPSIHMPRWASRITLEVVDVWVERLREISEGDCIAEGCPPEYLLGQNWYKSLWDSINAKRGFGWDVNPWCWVIEFRRIEE